MARRLPSSSPGVRLVKADEEAELVARCRAGEPEALRRLFDRERVRLHRMLYRMVGSNAHMDDLIQDTFLEVFRSLRSFRGESALSTWIDRCAVRVVYAHFRKKARLPWLEPVREVVSQAPGPEERAWRREAIRRLYLQLEKLDPNQRMAFTLSAIEGRPLREVADMMDSTVTTAKLRAWRARRLLESQARLDPLLSEFLGTELQPVEAK
jgi:RNA polymerase sigma-70 factor (ECF subfamily)